MVLSKTQLPIHNYFLNLSTLCVHGLVRSKEKARPYAYAFQKGCSVHLGI